MTMDSTTYLDIQVDFQIDEEFQKTVQSDLILEAITKTLHHQKIEKASLTLVITDDEQIRQLNHAYRGIDAPTDVLSFAEQEAAAESFTLPDDLAAEMATYLGDILIAYPYTERQAQRNQTPILSELRLLAIHGTLHLLGYDHATVQEEAEMWAIQDIILKQFDDR